MCVAPATCASDQECPRDQHCEISSGRCVLGARPCQDDNGCPTGRRCDTSTSECVECLDTFQCAAPLICVARACVDPSADAGFPDAQDLPDGGSSDAGHVDGGQCTTDQECVPPATVCVAGACVLGCAQPGAAPCANGTVCDSQSGQCVNISGPCSTDSQCGPPSTVCEGGQCVPGCASFGGVQCSGGQTCDTATGRCVAGGPVCTTDLQCNVPTTVCNLFSGVCEPGCGTRGCTAPATCNMASGHCEGGTCQPDRLEPNDTIATATMLAGAQSNLTICAGDVDHLAFAMTAGDQVTGTLTFVAGEGNLDLELLDPSGAVVATARTQNSPETLSHTAAATGNYVLRVTMAQDLGPTPGNTYSIQASFTAAPCLDDALEENDDELSARLTTQGNYPGLRACTMDEDFYDITLQAGDQITVNLTFSHAEGDIDMQLLGLFGISVASAVSSTDNETLTYTTTNGGTFSLRVYLLTDAGTRLGNDYGMNIAISGAPPPQCSPDRYEPNESATAATALAPGSQANLSLCPSDQDYYALNLVAGDQLTFSLSFTNAEGDIDLTLANPSGTQVGSSAGTGNSESISFTAAVTGTHHARVHLYGDSGTVPGNTYSLNYAVTPANVCLVDRYEINNTRNTATSLALGNYLDLGSCPSDDDFYAFTLSAGVTTNFRVFFTDAEGDVDIVLQDANGTTVASSAGVVDNESFSYAPTAAGTYFFRVYLYGDAGTRPGNLYRMEVGP